MPRLASIHWNCCYEAVVHVVNSVTSDELMSTILYDRYLLTKKEKDTKGYPSG